MPNHNYEAGRRFEYERLNHYRDLGYCALRTAGSHGKYDLVIVDSERSLVTLIQCKVVQNLSTGKRLMDDFRSNPPLIPMRGVHQCLEVKVRGSKEVHSVTI